MRFKFTELPQDQQETLAWHENVDFVSSRGFLLTLSGPKPGFRKPSLFNLTHLYDIFQPGSFIMILPPPTSRQITYRRSRPHIQGESGRKLEHLNTLRENPTGDLLRDHRAADCSIVDGNEPAGYRGFQQTEICVRCRGSACKQAHLSTLSPWRRSRLLLLLLMLQVVSLRLQLSHQPGLYPPMSSASRQDSHKQTHYPHRQERGGGEPEQSSGKIISINHNIDWSECDSTFVFSN